MFVPLRVKTDYSMLQSLIVIPKLLLFLQKYKIPVCGICDTNLFGVMEFYDTLTSNQIKPLIGLEINIENPVLLYARDYEGYLGLLKIETYIEKNELTKEQIIPYQEHLNIVIPFLNKNELESWNKFSHVYIGVSTEYEKNNANLITPHTVYMPEIRAFFKKETTSLKMLKAIDLGNPYKSIQEENLEKKTMEYYFNENLWDESTKDFCESCNVIMKKEGNYIPKYCEDSATFLFNLAQKGLAKRLNNKISKIYDERLKYELSVIQEMGFSNYFLIVYDYVKFAKKNGILVGAGRGSAVGSLVSYCLGITDVDPIEYHLFFERFLNPERVTMPDIDIDFEEDRRNEVVNYVKQKYGIQNVGSIMTFGTLKSKLVLRCVGKALEMDQKGMESFLNKIDAKLTLQENLQNKEVAYYVSSHPWIKEMYEASLPIEGLKKHISTHAAGVVISSVPLDTVIPIHYNGEELVTGVTMNYLEELGLLKMDFLALRNLTIMKRVLELIKENTNKTLDIHKLNLNDEKVLKLFQTADTMGIFQFESEGMKNFLRKLKPTKFLDLVSAIALFRPGPMENIDTYIRRKEGKEKINYLHDDLKPILEETYGIIIYQEQIMQILSLIGGFSFAESDLIRRAMSKKKKDLIESSKEKFIQGAMKKGYSVFLAEEIFALILKFANYGFNKSHSVSYALIGYQMAYLKCYYPIFFLANILNMNVYTAEKTKEYLALARKSHIAILPVDINLSEGFYKMENNSLRIPFSLIKNLGEEGVKTIVNQRKEKKFTDFFDFVARTYGKSITKAKIESLIESGAFEQFTTNQNSLLASLDTAINYATLTSDLDEDYILKPSLKEVEEESPEEKRKREWNNLGFYLSNHPASKYTSPNIMKLEFLPLNYDKQINSVVLIEKIKTITTKKGEEMAFLTGSDETATGNFVVFASMMKEMQSINIGDVVHIQGRVARRLDEYQINVNKIEKLTEGE